MIKNKVTEHDYYTIIQINNNNNNKNKLGFD